QAELRRSGFEDLLAAGIVLTGGSAKMEGVVELAEEIFHMPVRLGTPTNVRGLKDIVNNPIYSTGVGLLMYGMHQQRNGERSSKPAGQSVWDRFKSWYQGNF